LLFLTRLFAVMEKMKEELEGEKTANRLILERDRIAQEIHDQIAQSVFFLNVKMEQIRMRTQNGQPIQKEIEKMQNSLRQTHRNVRQVIAHLKQPGENALFGWKEMATETIRRFADDSDLEVESRIDDDREMAPEEKAALLACLQELLVNIRKHARATRVRVDFLSTDKGWRMSVSDNGVGMPEQFEGSGFGIRMIRERADRMGAEVAFLAGEKNEGGTAVIIKKERR
jgi:two-component system nitrate/nitrite sensor histidine kinase NarQ